MAPGSADERSVGTLWRSARLRLIAFGILLAALLAGALLSTVGALNRGPYSAAGFVDDYLRGLASGDVAGVLRMPGLAGTLPTAVPQDATVAPSRALLRADAGGAPRTWRIARSVPGPHGTERVDVDLVAADGTSSGVNFDVEPTDAALGIFSRWRFASPPWALLRIRALGDPVVTVGRERLDVRLGRGGRAYTFDTTGTFVALVGTSLRITQRTSLLRSDAIEAGLSTSGTVTTVTVKPAPTAAFERRVARELSGFLDRCARAEVLFPPGCPFGLSLGNRLVGAPHWAIERTPEVHLAAGTDAWVSTGGSGTARVTGRVRSLFDGSVSALDRRIVFPVSLAVTLSPDGTLRTVVR